MYCYVSFVLFSDCVYCYAPFTSSNSLYLAKKLIWLMLSWSGPFGFPDEFSERTDGRLIKKVVMFSVTYNLSMSVAKTSTFSGR